MSTIAFLGLGRMGAPMARRLVAAGHDLTGWNRTSTALDGATVAATPAAAVAGADLVITMLADPAAVEAVLFGPDGAAPAMPADAVLVEMSTIGPTALAALRRRLPGAVVDAPVGGSVDRAATGELVVLVGGTPAAVDRVAPVLAALGTVRRTGGPGTAAAAKLVLNTAMLAGLALLGEVRELAEALDVPAEPLLATGPLAALVDRAGSTGARFAVGLAVKDLALALDHADELRGDLPLTRAALARATALAAQAGDHDASLLATPIRKESP